MEIFYFGTYEEMINKEKMKMKRKLSNSKKKKKKKRKQKMTNNKQIMSIKNCCPKTVTLKIMVLI